MKRSELMDKYYHIPMDKERCQEELKDEINFTKELISIAVEEKGLAFGGFVRDAIVRNSSFKDLDLWFKNEDTANKFLERLRKLVDSTSTLGTFSELPRYILMDGGNTFRPGREICKKYCNLPFHSTCYKGYRCPRMTVHMAKCYGLPVSEDPEGMHYKTIEFDVDIVVSEEFPCDDFDVNMLTYDNTSLQLGNLKLLVPKGQIDKSLPGSELFENITNTSECLDEIVRRIKSGKAMMTDYYRTRLVDKVEDIVHFKRMENYMLRKTFEVTNASPEIFEKILTNGKRPLMMERDLIPPPRAGNKRRRLLDDVYTDDTVDFGRCGNAEIKMYAQVVEDFIETGRVDKLTENYLRDLLYLGFKSKVEIWQMICSGKLAKLAKV